VAAVTFAPHQFVATSSQKQLSLTLKPKPLSFFFWTMTLHAANYWFLFPAFSLSRAARTQQPASFGLFYFFQKPLKYLLGQIIIQIFKMWTCFADAAQEPRVPSTGCLTDRFYCVGPCV